jgi:hypothetical protein
MESIAKSLLHEVALVALCRGWPETLPLAALREIARTKLMQDYFGEPRYGIEAMRGRLQTDQECRKPVFAAVQKVTAPDTWIALAKLLAPSMRTVPAFGTWISNQLRAARESSRVICQLAFDVLANACTLVEFALREVLLTRY